ncbi:G2/mitotic-specific cyclin-B3 isoform X1 [Hydra vulgaris]|nr:G2/mitotic-specific cyclin-B3 [Hydra vulgaris]
MKETTTQNSKLHIQERESTMFTRSKNQRSLIAKQKPAKRSVSDISPNKAIETRKRTAFGDITNAIQAHTHRLNLARKRSKSIDSSKQAQKSKLKLSTITTRNRTKKTDSKPNLEKNEADISLPCFISEHFSSAIENGNSSKMEQSFTSDKSECHEQSKDMPEQMNVSSTSSSGSLSGKVRPVPVIPASILQKVEEDIRSPINKYPDGLRPYDTELRDPFLVAEYAESIFQNLKKREAKYPVINYLIKENCETTGPMRAILVDWLVEVQENFELYHETLYLAVKLVDNFLQNNPTPKEQLQLVGATALLIACKIEEHHPPPLDDFQYICDDAYTHKMFINMELKIFKALDFDVNIPISYSFLRRYARVTSMSMQLLTLARYILELSLQEAQFVDVRSSKISAACLCLALKMKDEGDWEANLSYHTGYQEKELSTLVTNLNTMVTNAPKSKLQTIRNKYLHPVFFEVAKIPAVDPLFL